MKSTSISRNRSFRRLSVTLTIGLPAVLIGLAIGPVTCLTAGSSLAEQAAKNPKYGAPLKPHAKIAFFGVIFVDTSTEGSYNGKREDETKRTQMLNQLVIERFEKAGMTIMDNAPIREQLDRIVNPANCYGCEQRMAQELGADYVLVGQVQKVSNLILSMNLVMRDPADGLMVRGMSADIRSNTDKSWKRGMNYILKNNFFTEENSK